MDKLHTVKIYGDSMLELLMDRLAAWNPSSYEEEIYESYYTDLIESGVFDDREFNVMEIVDNDWVNYITIMTPSDVVDNFDLDLAEDISDENMSEIDFADAVAEALENDGIGASVYEVNGKYYIMAIQG